MAARIVAIGEELGTTVESRSGGIVSGLQAALNPDAVTAIDNAVEDDDEGLQAIADLLGETPEEFAAAWRADSAAAFARFADALAAAEDGDDVADQLFLGEIVSLPVHPDGVLLGSTRIDRPDGSRGFVVAYDVPLEDVSVESTVAAQLDRSPWQVTGGESGAAVSNVFFESTINADVVGLAWVQPLPARAAIEDSDDDGEDEEGASPSATTSLLYVIETQPRAVAEDPPFVLRTGRPLPDSFPATFFLDGEITISAVSWNSVPGATAYRLTAFTRNSPFDVVDDYRALLEERGWEIVDDRAVGFGTVISFTSADGALQGTASIDTFEEDDDYTAILLELQTSSRGGE
jgi:hypothetical protein